MLPDAGVLLDRRPAVPEERAYRRFFRRRSVVTGRHGNRDADVTLAAGVHRRGGHDRARHALVVNFGGADGRAEDAHDQVDAGGDLPLPGGRPGREETGAHGHFAVRRLEELQIGRVGDAVHLAEVAAVQRVLDDVLRPGPYRHRETWHDEACSIERLQVGVEAVVARLVQQREHESSGRDRTVPGQRKPVLAGRIEPDAPAVERADDVIRLQLAAFTQVRTTVWTLDVVGLKAARPPDEHQRFRIDEHGRQLVHDLALVRDLVPAAMCHGAPGNITDVRFVSTSGRPRGLLPGARKRPGSRPNVFHFVVDKLNGFLLLSAACGLSFAHRSARRHAYTSHLPDRRSGTHRVR